MGHLYWSITLKVAKTPQVISRFWNGSKQNLQRELAITLKHFAVFLKCLIKDITSFTKHYKALQRHYKSASQTENKLRDLASIENDFFSSYKASQKNSGNLFDSRIFHQEDDNIYILFSMNNQCFIGLSAACTGHDRMKAIQREWLALCFIR